MTSPPQNNKSGLCGCGCGLPTAYGWVRGHNRVPDGPAYIVDSDTGCWIWQRALNTNGYGKLTRNGKSYAAHRWYYDQLVVGGAPEGDLHHKCKNPRCVNPEHLEPHDRAEHSHAQEDGRSRLTWEIVREIRASSLSNGDLAEKYGVKKPAIVRIRKNYRWHDPDYSPSS